MIHQTGKILNPKTTKQLKLSTSPIIFAPMDGITDAPYRNAVMKIFPEWDYFSTEFLRIPTSGTINKKSIINHIGDSIFNKSEMLNKTIMQILTTERAKTEETVRQIEELEIPWLDLNVGCPSKKVNSHLGGAYLLKNHTVLENLIKKIRKIFSGKFSVKMRIGYYDDLNFIKTIKLMENEGVDLITVHARTKIQLYSGKADWKYIQQAVQNVEIPIIANGDIWSTDDIHNIHTQSQCHSVMIGRGALKTPWLARLFKLGEDDDFKKRIKIIPTYFETVEEEYRNADQSEAMILGRFKALSKYIFKDFKNHEQIKKEILPSSDLENFKQTLKTYCTEN